MRAALLAVELDCSRCPSNITCTTKRCAVAVGHQSKHQVYFTDSTHCAQRSYRAVLRHSLLYTWDNEAGQPWYAAMLCSCRACSVLHAWLLSPGWLQAGRDTAEREGRV